MAGGVVNVGVVNVGAGVDFVDLGGEVAGEVADGVDSAGVAPSGVATPLGADVEPAEVVVVVVVAVVAVVVVVVVAVVAVVAAVGVVAAPRGPTVPRSCSHV